jgi:hypothetical protein
MIAQPEQLPVLTEAGVSTKSVIGEDCPGGGTVLLLKMCSGNSGAEVPMPMFPVDD